MKTTLTFEDGEAEGGIRSTTDLELHLRGPNIARVVFRLYKAVKIKAEGGPLIPMSRALEPEQDAVTWAEVLELLEEHFSDISDLL